MRNTTYFPLYTNDFKVGSSMISSPLARSVSLDDDEIISISVETFEGYLYTFYTVGKTVKNKNLFSQFVSSQGVGFKSICSFEFVTSSGCTVHYYRNYRSQEFKLDRTRSTNRARHDQAQ